MKTWHYAYSAEEQFQISEEELPTAIQQGKIKPETRVWSKGMAGWTSASEAMPQLFSAAPAPAPAQQGPPAIPQQQPAPAPAPAQQGPPAIPQQQPAPAQSAATGRPPGQQSHEIDFEIFGDDMQIVEVELDPGETVIAEAGAMNYVEPDVTFEAKMGDGTNPGEGVMGKLLSVGKRALTGESIFMTHFTHSGPEGKRRVAFAAPYPGKIIPVDLGQNGGELICQKDAFLCAAMGTQVTITLNRKLGTGFFGGEGFILQKLKGDGKAFIHAGGTVIERELKGETLRVDTGCLVGFSPGIDYNIEKAGNLKSMFFGGEGLFLATLCGHGRVWLQSLPFSRMADRILAKAPSAGGSRQGEGSVLGALGGIIDGDR